MGKRWRVAVRRPEKARASSSFISLQSRKIVVKTVLQGPLKDCQAMEHGVVSGLLCGLSWAAPGQSMGEPRGTESK